MKLLTKGNVCYGECESKFNLRLCYLQFVRNNGNSRKQPVRREGRKDGEWGWSLSTWFKLLKWAFYVFIQSNLTKQKGIQFRFCLQFCYKNLILLRSKSQGEQFNSSEQQAVIVPDVIRLSLISVTLISLYDGGFCWCNRLFTVK